MSEEKQNEPTQITPGLEASLQPTSMEVPVWSPPPPAPPANSFWHRIAAAVVLAAVVAASAGAGIGWSLAHAIDTHRSAPVATQTEAPIQPETSGSSSGSLNAAALAAKIDPAIVDINTTLASGGQAAGTGMIVTSSGEVLTNNHVVQGSTNISVSIQGRSRTYTAHVVAVDISQDVALIKIEGVSGLPTVTFADSSSLKVGDSVVAIGNALGQGGKPHVTQGAVTGLDQTITASEGGGQSETLNGMIESDALIYAGDSGGALVNAAGQVVGMITAGQAQGFRSSASNVGYAITSNTGLNIINRIRAGDQAADLTYGQVGYIGVSVQTLTPAGAAQLGLNVSSGALVISVQAGSPAEAAGITRGSVITSVAGTAMSSSNTLGIAVKAHKPGERVSVTWVDQSGTHTATATLGAINP
jgi:S1-C subfamily serine protease